MSKLSGVKRGSENIIMDDVSQPSKRVRLFRTPRKFTGRKSNKYAPKITSIRQVTMLGSYTSTATGDSLGSLKFNFDDVPGFSDLAAVFDQYKLDKVDLRFVPNGTNAALVGGGASQIRSILYTAIDYNDATAPTLLNDLIQYQNCTQTPYCEELRRTIYPRVGVESSDNEGVISLNPSNSWCSSSSKDIDWYGLKWGISANGNSAGTTQVWVLHAKMYFSFKNIK